MAEIKDLEDTAHEQMALVSTDALRYFLRYSEGEDRIEKFSEYLIAAKNNFPSEDGWLILNLSRMEEILKKDEVSESEVTPLTKKVEENSLAEAILMGDIKLALGLIEERPMLSLASATSDLDAAYRYKKFGDEVIISELLKREVNLTSEEKLEEVIKALTSAIDGTYTDEAEAVKTALMKAVNTVNK